jgi:lipoate-protein ligase A
MRGNFSGCEQGVVSLAECGVLLDRNKLLAEIISAFSNSFAIEFDDYVLFSDEIIMSNNLKNNKYVADSWNLGGVGG